jgi:hypothetical protein
MSACRKRPDRSVPADALALAVLYAAVTVELDEGEIVAVKVTDRVSPELVVLHDPGFLERLQADAYCLAIVMPR